MNGAVFPDHVIVSDFNRAFCSRFEGKILRGGSDHGAVSDKIATAKNNAPFHDDMPLNDAVGSNHRVSPDNRAGPDIDVWSDLGAGIDERGWMNSRPGCARSPGRIPILFQRTPASLKLK